MAWFKRSSGEPEPAVRPDQVMKLLNLMMRESDAGDRELMNSDDPSEPSPDFDRAKAELVAEWGRSTEAEIRAAYEAARRHGYV
jgi:hypothetical protein